MSITSAELVWYASANMPVDDSATSGGAIDLKNRVDFTQMAANDTVRAVSDAAGDTQNATLTGRNAAGSIVAETKAMTGVTPITFSVAGTLERVLKFALASDAVGTITVARTTGPTTIRTVPIGERGFQALFQRVSSDPSVEVDNYMKIFAKNTNGTLSLLSATVSKTADPIGLITFALAAAVDDSVSVANRVTSPGLTFNNTAKAVPGTDLAAGSAIGVWAKLALPAAEAAHKSTVTFALTGSST